MSQWVLHHIKNAANLSERLAADSALQWGLHITPLMCMHISTIRAGLRRTANGDLLATLMGSGLQLTNQQLRYFQPCMWGQNSSVPREAKVALMCLRNRLFRPTP